MKTYHKIQTLFFRDPATNYKELLIGEFSKPEFEYLKDLDWLIDEKLDGTNVRILWDGFEMEIRGKTDNAQLHTDLIKNIQKQITPEKLGNQFGTGRPLDRDGNCQDIRVCLYGEGVGPGIQKGGGNYCQEKKFILFDVLIGSVWLMKSNVEDIAIAMGIEIAPSIDICDLNTAVQMTRDGFKSEYGDFIAEGIIARPVVPLRNRMGERVITKLKHSDFHGGH